MVESLSRPLEAAKEEVERDRYFDIRTTYIERHLARLERYLPQRGNVVDIGCGMGPGAITLAKRGLAIVGIDIDTSGKVLPYATRRAEREGLIINLVQGGTKPAISTRAPNLICER